MVLSCSGGVHVGPVFAPGASDQCSPDPPVARLLPSGPFWPVQNACLWPELARPLKIAVGPAGQWSMSCPGCSVAMMLRCCGVVVQWCCGAVVLRCCGCSGVVVLWC